MRTPLAILASAALVMVATLWPTENNKLTAWRKLEASVEKLRPLVESSGFASDFDAEGLACKAKLATIDDALNERASADDGIGARWMWSPKHRAELFALVEDVTPMLDELAQIAEHRRGLLPIPSRPSLRRTRHRTNLFCAAALIESDSIRARLRFEQAWEVATMEDDGAWWPLAIQLSNAGIIADAIRLRSARLQQRDEVLAQSMQGAFARAFTQRGELERNARGLVDMVDQPNRPELEMWALEGGLVASSEMHPALMGSVSLEDLAARIGHKLFVGMYLCDRELSKSIAHNLRL